MPKKTPTLHYVRAILYVTIWKLFLYFLFSLFFLWLLNWASLLDFSIKNAIVLAITIFFIWFFIENNITSKLKTLKDQ